MITIINYGSGNINAITNIYQQLNIPYKVASTPGEIIGSERLILPGVGAFDETVTVLDKSGFRSALETEVFEKGVPVLGICVGMQILAERSEEGTLPGLGWIKGEVKKLDKNQIAEKPKTPHMGWNSVDIQKHSSLFSEIDTEEGFYFLHNYYFECKDETDVLASTVYGGSFTSAVHHNNIFGVQFHPEKSHHNGVRLLKNFSTI